VLLTTGSRSSELSSAVASIREATPDAPILVVGNGCSPLGLPDDVDVLALAENIGIPAARDLALRDSTEEIIAFLDDDARIENIDPVAVRRFATDPTLGVIAMRIADEEGECARRHIPRVGRSGPHADGRVGTFLGGACMIRRTAYLDAGGYWSELWYGHEELEFAWRLADAEYTISYEPSCVVFHPRMPIGRHADGWRLTGRNRVRIARRTLPWSVALVHTATWLALGSLRAARDGAAKAYVSGWIAGWRDPVGRNPVSYATVVRLFRHGRPPIF